MIESIVHSLLEQPSITIVIVPSTSLSTRHFFANTTHTDLSKVYALELVLVEWILVFAFQKLRVVVFGSCREIVPE